MSIFYQVRREYALSDLSENDLTESPFELFETWLQQVMQIDKISDPTAMIVATVDEQGQSYQRTVLMKAVDDTGITFYTNKQSRKGKQLAQNNRISAIFPWLAAERQVVFSGEVVELTDAKNDEYFASRPFESKIAAIASAQSEIIDSRESLEQKYHALVEQYQGKEVPRPKHWGGYKIIAEQVEFWQGGEFRMHDRFLYQRTNSDWKVCRLQP
ncbi:pyridoxamine 5'-phosphate oxidase [Catenovulum sp. SX2]|uniref:pyridoxamine 5'-phosphate oxidase n=1 Tax=Catenovulum TaxID=1172191 RepID=UPI00031B5582|nr:pyridoxamine 5'-phosphate oxidase [Catenovulum agarivorans]